MASDFRMVIISGLSGSGKTTTVHELEDLGFFCVDNLPIALLPKFMEILSLSRAEIRSIALVIDIREREFLPDFPGIYRTLKEQEIPIELIFLECDDVVLARRFSETRRRHPLAAGSDLISSIAREREELKVIRDLADKVWDTTHTNYPNFRREVREYFSARGGEPEFRLTLLSFSYRSGIPFNADLVLDVRCLPNPHFMDELRPRDGTDPAVQDYIFGQTEGKHFLEHTRQYLEHILPLYRQEGKPSLTIAFGCTGGQHRSVALSDRLGKILSEAGHHVSVFHRDLG